MQTSLIPAVLGITVLVFPGLPAVAQEAFRIDSSSVETTSAATVHADQRYSDDTRAGRCDVYLPTEPPPKEGYPVVVVVHGGGWMSGDKWTLAGYSRRLAKHGFVAITINYRLAPAAKFPAQVDDVREALLWTQANASRWKIDISRLGLFGYSAGGHLCALVSSLADEPHDTRVATSHWPSSDPRWTRLPKITAVCIGGPPCDFRPLPIDNTTLAYFLGGSRREKSDLYVAASPSAHVSASDPMTQIIHGDADLIVPITSSQAFHQAQLAAGVVSHLEVMRGQGHMSTFLSPKTSEKMLKFFKENL